MVTREAILIAFNLNVVNSITSDVLFIRNIRISISLRDKATKSVTSYLNITRNGHARNNSNCKSSQGSYEYNFVPGHTVRS